MKTERSIIYGVLAAMIMSALHAAPGDDDKPNVVPQDVFDGMRKSFQPEKARGVRARYQWQLSGENGGEWWIDVNDGTFTMEKGKIDNPDVTFIASDKTWVALSNGTLGGTWAWISGRLKIRGDQGLARKLNEIFP